MIIVDDRVFDGPMWSVHAERDPRFRLHVVISYCRRCKCAARAEIKNSDVEAGTVSVEAVMARMEADVRAHEAQCTGVVITGYA